MNKILACDGTLVKTKVSEENAYQNMYLCFVLDQYRQTIFEKPLIEKTTQKEKETRFNF